MNIGKYIDDKSVLYDIIEYVSKNKIFLILLFIVIYSLMKSKKSDAPKYKSIESTPKTNSVAPSVSVSAPYVSAPYVSAPSVSAPILTPAQGQGTIDGFLQPYRRQQNHNRNKIL